MRCDGNDGKDDYTYRRHLAFFVCHVHSRDVSLRAFEHVWVFERKKSRAGRPVAAFRQLHVRDARFDRVPDEGDLCGVGDDEGTARGAPTRRKARDTTLPRRRVERRRRR